MDDMLCFDKFRSLLAVEIEEKKNIKEQLKNVEDKVQSIETENAVHKETIKAVKSH